MAEGKDRKRKRQRHTRVDCDGTGPAPSIIGPHYLHKQARWQPDGREMKLRQGDRSACVGLMVDEYTSCLGGGL